MKSLCLLFLWLTCCLGLIFLCHLQRELSRTIQEQKQLSEKLQDETEQKEQLKRLKNEMDSERRHLSETIEKLQKEVRSGRGWGAVLSGPRSLEKVG